MVKIGSHPTALLEHLQCEIFETAVLCEWKKVLLYLPYFPVNFMGDYFNFEGSPDHHKQTLIINSLSTIISTLSKYLPIRQTK